MVRLLSEDQGEDEETRCPYAVVRTWDRRRGELAPRDDGSWE